MNRTLTIDELNIKELHAFKAGVTLEQLFVLRQTRDDPQKFAEFLKLRAESNAELAAAKSGASSGTAPFDLKRVLGLAK